MSKQKNVKIESLNISNFFSQEELERIKDKPREERLKLFSDRIMNKSIEAGHQQGISEADIRKSLTTENYARVVNITNSSDQTFSSKKGLSKLEYISNKFDNELSYGKPEIDQNNPRDVKTQSIAEKQEEYAKMKWHFSVNIPGTAEYAKSIVADLSEKQGFTKIKEIVMSQCTPQCEPQGIPKEILTEYFPQKPIGSTNGGTRTLINCNGQSSLSDLMADDLYNALKNVYENSKNATQQENRLSEEKLNKLKPQDYFTEEELNEIKNINEKDKRLDKVKEGLSKLPNQVKLAKYFKLKLSELMQQTNTQPQKQENGVSVKEYQLIDQISEKMLSIMEKEFGQENVNDTRNENKEQPAPNDKPNQNEQETQSDKPSENEQEKPTIEPSETNKEAQLGDAIDGKSKNVAPASAPGIQSKFLTEEFNKLIGSVNKNDPDAVEKLLDNPQYDKVIRQLRNADPKSLTEEEKGVLDNYKNLKAIAVENANKKAEAEASQEREMGISMSSDDDGDIPQ